MDASNIENERIPTPMKNNDAQSWCLDLVPSCHDFLTVGQLNASIASMVCTRFQNPNRATPPLLQESPFRGPPSAKEKNMVGISMNTAAREAALKVVQEFGRLLPLNEGCDKWPLEDKWELMYTRKLYDAIILKHQCTSAGRNLETDPRTDTNANSSAEECVPSSGPEVLLPEFEDELAFTNSNSPCPGEVWAPLADDNGASLQ